MLIGVAFLAVYFGFMGIMIYYRIALPEPSGKESDPFVLMEEYINGQDTEVVLYGSDINFRKNMIRWTPVDVIDADKIHTNHKHVYLIVNDLDNEIDLTDDDCAELVEYADNNPWFSFVYLGKDKLGTFSELAHDKEGVNKGSLSFGYEYSNNSRIINKAIWDEGAESRSAEDTPALLGDNIISSIYRTSVT